MSKTTIPATSTPKRSRNSIGLSRPPFHPDSAEREAQRYNPIEFLSWARTIIRYSEIRGGLFDVAGITRCWQEYVLDAFRAELEAMKGEGDLHLYGLDKPETLANVEQRILQEVAIIVREDTHNKLLVHKESQGRRVTRANAATAVAALAKEKRLRRRLVVVYLPDSQGKKSKVKGSKKTKAM